VIVEFLASLGGSIATFFAGFFGTIEIPAFVSDSAPVLYDFLDSASGISAWIPWAVISPVLGARVSVYLVAFVARLAQKIWGLVPVVGGSG